ncbi:MAG: glycyl-radical enzyme activating protein [Clostridia bacterium]|nr:glycyl-radical enzyme activating protein [Clostridia bacterium]
MEGNIFDIQRFCVHDGPGIRTTVFFKGCPLKCIWCHNPESQKAAVDLAYYADKCFACGDCAQACPESCHTYTEEKHIFNRSACTTCGKCAKSCAFGALELLGKRESVEGILSEVIKDSKFYKNSGGGMTVSGGEPLMQREFLAALLKGAKEQGIHTCIETCGFASQDAVAEIAKYTDIFLFDIKETDDDRHKELTGVPFSPILSNLMLLNSIGASVILRCPLVPDVNTREEHLFNIAKIASSLDNLLEVNVMAYHLLGNSKYDALDMKNKLCGRKAMSAEQKAECIGKISENIKQISGKHIRVC